MEGQRETCLLCHAKELEHFQKGCGNQRLENQGITKDGCGKMEEQETEQWGSLAPPV